MRSVFRQHLTELEREMFNMADMVTSAITSSVYSLKNQNLEMAKSIKKGDVKINNKRWEIEEKCINLIATQQPVATDLREVIAVLTIITDLERMGDYAEGIAKITKKIGTEPHVKSLIDIPRMCELSVEMINSSMNAYAERDDKAARIISDKDDEVDELYKQIYRELTSIMIEDPRTISSCTYLLWAAHNLERIADRVTNICERIIFLVTGELVENL